VGNFLDHRDLSLEGKELLWLKGEREVTYVERLPWRERTASLEGRLVENETKGDGFGRETPLTSVEGKGFIKVLEGRKLRLLWKASSDTSQELLLDLSGSGRGNGPGSEKNLSGVLDSGENTELSFHTSVPADFDSEGRERLAPIYTMTPIV
jgi:hypothetical protein